MKPNRFYTFLMCSFLTCIILAAKKPARNAPSALSERQANLAKDEARTLVKTYYFDIKTITGENIDSASDQNNIIDEIQQDCFRGPEVVVDNNISEISQDNLDVKNYLKSISVLSDKIEKIGFDENITLSSVYYNSNDDYFYLVASVDQVVAIKNASGVNKKVDFYVSFNPIKGLKPKIYSVQNHKDGVLNDQNLVHLAADGGVEKTTDVSKPYFTFDISPNNADIAIDGKSVYFDGNSIETTPGDHIIEIMAPNYQDLKFGVVASDTGAQRIERNLTSKHGYLFISPDDNTIQDPLAYIDGNMVGNLPIANYQLDVGPHDIEIKGGNNFYKLYHVAITDENTTTLKVRGNAKAAWAEQKNAEETPAPADVSYQQFYDALSPYGQWVDDPQYGNVWVPDNQDADFRPYYTNGNWAMTDAGNTWVSDEPWGWACYHYGRWVYNDYYNWLWVPGYEWAPAWVTWRSNDAYCGWAPMAPGLSFGVSNGCPSSWWVFIGTGNLYDRGYANYRIRAENNVAYIKQTTIVNNSYSNNTHARYYSGPSQSAIENATHKKINVYHLSQSASPGKRGIDGQELSVYKPDLRSPNPYSAHPSSVIVPRKPIASTQEISASRSGSNFRQDIQSNKLQRRQIYVPGGQPQSIQTRQQQATQQETPQQQQQRIQQQRAQQQSTQQETPQQEQQRVQQQRVQQQAKQQETPQQEQQRIQQQRGGQQSTQQETPQQEQQRIQQQRVQQQAAQQQTQQPVQQRTQQRQTQQPIQQHQSGQSVRQPLGQPVKPQQQVQQSPPQNNAPQTTQPKKQKQSFFKQLQLKPASNTPPPVRNQKPAKAKS